MRNENGDEPNLFEISEHCQVWPQWIIEFIAAVAHGDSDGAKELRMCLEGSVAALTAEFDPTELFVPFTAIRKEPFILDGFSYANAHTAAFAATTGFLQLIEKAAEGKRPASEIKEAFQRCYAAVAMLGGAMEHERMWLVVSIVDEEIEPRAKEIPRELPKGENNFPTPEQMEEIRNAVRMQGKSASVQLIRNTVSMNYATLLNGLYSEWEAGRFTGYKRKPKPR